MSGHDEIRLKVAEAALRLAADRPWAQVTLQQIAAEASLGLQDLYGLMTRDDVDTVLDARHDRAMLDEPVSAEEPPRERLFEAIMLRFEAMEPDRAGLLSLMKSRDRSPDGLLSRSRSFLKTAEWALIAAGLDTDTGAPMRLKTLAISRVIAETERAWRRETSGDFARTMATLDKALRKMEDRLVWWQKITGQAAPAKSSRQEPDNETKGETSDEDAVT